MSHVQQEDWKEDQDEGGEKTMHAKVTQGRKARAKGIAQTFGVDLKFYLQMRKR